LFGAVKNRPVELRRLPVLVGFGPVERRNQDIKPGGDRHRLDTHPAERVRLRVVPPWLRHLETRLVAEPQRRRREVGDVVAVDEIQRLAPVVEHDDTTLAVGPLDCRTELVRGPRADVDQVTLGGHVQVVPRHRVGDVYCVACGHSPIYGGSPNSRCGDRHDPRLTNPSARNNRGPQSNGARFLRRAEVPWDAGANHDRTGRTRCAPPDYTVSTAKIRRAIGQEPTWCSAVPTAPVVTSRR
jgi:hypothetical protein